MERKFRSSVFVTPGKATAAPVPSSFPLFSYSLDGFPLIFAPPRSIPSAIVNVEALHHPLNPLYLVTAQQMRELDRLTIEHGTPGHVLMERAGAGATVALLKTFPQVRSAPVLVFAGKGNNGGDGFVMARLLKKEGVACEVILIATREDVKG